MSDKMTFAAMKTFLRWYHLFGLGLDLRQQIHQILLSKAQFVFDKVMEKKVREVERAGASKDALWIAEKFIRGSRYDLNALPLFGTPLIKLPSLYRHADESTPALDLIDVIRGSTGRSLPLLNGAVGDPEGFEGLINLV